MIAIILLLVMLIIFFIKTGHGEPNVHGEPHNILLNKIIKNNDLKDPDMIQMLTNVNNYLFNHPEIKKEANWDATTTQYYPILDIKNLEKIFANPTKITYINVGAGSGGSFYEDAQMLRQLWPAAEIIVINRDVKDFIGDDLKNKLEKLQVEYVFEAADTEKMSEVDIAVMKVSLHHIPDAFDLIDNLNAKMVVIREANVITSTDLHMQTVEHILYHMLETPDRKTMTLNEMQKYFEEYETNTGRFADKTDNYFSRDQWLEQFSKYKSVANNADRKYKDSNNPSKIYREVFVYREI